MANYINAYANQAQYDADATKQYPNVSLLRDSGTIVHKKREPKPYLTFVAEEAGTFKFSGNSISYSLDDGDTWVTLASNTNTPTVPSGGKISWKATLAPASYKGIGTFSSTGSFSVEGNIMSLLYGDNFVGQKDLTGKNFAFFHLFNGCDGLTSAEDLVLPAETLSNDCYDSMFAYCTSLTTAPALPSVWWLELAPSCCYCMFSNCESLTTAQALPATTLANNCYSEMFGGCTSLTTAPELPADTLANGCYSQMFNGCTSLTAAPELPATTLSQNCYNGMFRDCTSLTTAPVMSATTLAEYCCSDMFWGCSSLTATPVLYALEMEPHAYENMFHDCYALNEVTMLAKSNLNASAAFEYWLESVQSSGTFYKNSEVNEWDLPGDAKPSGDWSYEDYDGDYPD